MRKHDVFWSNADFTSADQSSVGDCDGYGGCSLLPDYHCKRRTSLGKQRPGIQSGIKSSKPAFFLSQCQESFVPCRLFLRHAR
jgi:hypothetical protein